MMDVLEAARVSARERRVVDVARHGQSARGQPAGGPMSISLERVALRAMVDNGFQPEPTAAARRELAALPDTPHDGVRDLRRLRWSSIDNVTSKDLDQIEVAEAMPDGGIRLRIGIADVDALVPKGSAIDAHAAENSTSVYTGISVFPMLPDALSTDRTSLVEGGERLVVVTELEIGRTARCGATRSIAPSPSTTPSSITSRSAPGSKGAAPSPTRSPPTTRSRRSCGCRIAPPAC